MRPLFRRISPYVDCLSTETFIKRLSGRSISSVVADAYGLRHSDATKLTWYGGSTGLFGQLFKRIADWLASQNLDVEDVASKRTCLIAGYLSGMPTLGESSWTTESQQYFNALALLEADLQAAGSAKDVTRMREAMAKSGVGRYLAMVTITGHRPWDEIGSVEEFQKECTGYARLLAMVGIALLDHELRIAVWSDHEPRSVFAPLLPQYRLDQNGSIKGLPVRPERRMLDVMYFAATGRGEAPPEGRAWPMHRYPPTDIELFPKNAESMVKRVQRATISAADCYAVSREWARSPESGESDSGESKGLAEERAFFEAHFFAAKAFGLLFDNTRPAKRKSTIPEMQKNYYVVWSSILHASPQFSGGECRWDRTRLERLIDDEIKQ